MSAPQWVRGAVACSQSRLQSTGWMPAALAVINRLIRIEAVLPPPSRWKNSQFLRPTANGRSARSAALFEIAGDVMGQLQDEIRLAGHLAFL